MITVVLSLLLALTAVLVALIYGGFPERCGAAIIVMMALIGFVGQLLVAPRYGEVDPARLMQDVIAFLGFSWIGINAKRVWPLWAAALQLLSVGAHFVRLIRMPMHPLVYAWMKSGPTWGVLIVLIAGSILYHRRRLRFQSRRAT